MSEPSYDDLRASRDGWKRGYEAKEAEVERLQGRIDEHIAQWDRRAAEYEAEHDRLREEVERLKRAGQDAVQRGFESRQECEAELRIAREENERLRREIEGWKAEVRYASGQGDDPLSTTEGA